MSVLTDRQHAFSHALADLFGWMKAQGYEWTLGDAWRSTDPLACSHCGHEVTYQGLLLYNHRSTVSKSTHNDRCALDIILWVNGAPSNTGSDYAAMGAKWVELGGRWGGSFKSFPDYGHVEM